MICSVLLKISCHLYLKISVLILRSNTISGKLNLIADINGNKFFFYSPWRYRLYTYLPYRPDGAQVVRVAFWSPKRGIIFLTNLSLFPEKFSKYVCVSCVSSISSTLYMLELLRITNVVISFISIKFCQLLIILFSAEIGQPTPKENSYKINVDKASLFYAIMLLHRMLKRSIWFSDIMVRK